MLTLLGGQVELLWDEVLPAGVRELPQDLARVDRVLLGDSTTRWSTASRAPNRSSASRRSWFEPCAVACLFRANDVQKRVV
jgi:hypothetical protein